MPTHASPGRQTLRRRRLVVRGRTRWRSLDEAFANDVNTRAPRTRGPLLSRRCGEASGEPSAWVHDDAAATWTITNELSWDTTTPRSTQTHLLKLAGRSGMLTAPDSRVLRGQSYRRHWKARIPGIHQVIDNGPYRLQCPSISRQKLPMSQHRPVALRLRGFSSRCTPPRRTPL